MHAPDGFARIEDLLGRDELRAIVRRYSQTAGFDVDELNARPSWSCRRSPDGARDASTV